MTEILGVTSGQLYQQTSRIENARFSKKTDVSMSQLETPWAVVKVDPDKRNEMLSRIESLKVHDLGIEKTNWTQWDNWCNDSWRNWDNWSNNWANGYS